MLFHGKSCIKNSKNSPRDIADKDKSNKDDYRRWCELLSVGNIVIKHLSATSVTQEH
jgi:hypothetical protein